MRSAFYSLMLLLLAPLALAQINPGQIAWPQPACSNPSAHWTPGANTCLPVTTTGGMPINNPQFTGTMLGPQATINTMSSSVNTQINVMAPPYNAKGDGVTDDGPAINAACAAAKAYFPPAQVVFPKAPAFYLASPLTTCASVSLKGQPVTGISEGKGGVIIQGKPGQDIVPNPDPLTPGTVDLAWQWDISDIQFRVDDSVDASASFPHRWPGRWTQDGAMTAGSAVLTSGAQLYTCSDIGQAVQVKGAGAAGATLITTIASLPSCNGPQGTVTLAAAASTNVSGALTYTSVDNVPATQTLGNCALAFDNRDGKASNWAHGNINVLNATMNNVSFISVSGSAQNNSCGIYFQGDWTPYGMKAENLNFLRLVWGVIQGTQDTNPASGNTGNDYSSWNHVTSQTTYPWISYNGSQTTLTGWQLYSVYGIVVSEVSTVVENFAGAWYISIPEFEGNGGHIGFIIKGTQHTLVTTGFDGDGSGGAMSYLETNNSTCITCSVFGRLTVNGSSNTVTLTGPSDHVINGGLIDNGIGNIVTAQNLAVAPKSQEPTRTTALNITRRPGFVNSRTPDFLSLGGSVPFFNQQDLLFFPEDFEFSATHYPVIADSNSFSGKYLKLAATDNTVGFANFNAISGGNAIISNTPQGGQVPAGLVTVYDAVKCPTDTSYTRSTMAGSTTVGVQSFPCSPTYTVNSMTVDLSSYNGQNFNIGRAPPTEVDIAWSAVVPVPTNITNAVKAQMLAATNTWTAPNTFNGNNVYGGTSTFNGAISSTANNVWSGTNTFNAAISSTGTNTWSGANTFSLPVIGTQSTTGPAGAFVAQSGVPAYLWNVQGAGTNQAWWRMIGIGASMHLQAMTDDNNSSNDVFIASRSGFYVTTIAMGGTQVQLPSTSTVGGNPIAAALTGTTAGLGGSAITAGSCATANVTVTGATNSMTVTVSPNIYPGDQFYWKGWVSSLNTVTVGVCTNLAGGGTPTSANYNVRVIP